MFAFDGNTGRRCERSDAMTIPSERDKLWRAACKVGLSARLKSIRAEIARTAFRQIPHLSDFAARLEPRRGDSARFHILLIGAPLRKGRRGICSLHTDQ